MARYVQFLLVACLPIVLAAPVPGPGKKHADVTKNIISKFGTNK